MPLEHSKGEWLISPDPLQVVCGGKVVCLVRAAAEGEWDECWANARLIASAPELLAACKTSLAVFQIGVPEMQMRAAVRALERAIGNATREGPTDAA